MKRFKRTLRKIGTPLLLTTLAIAALLGINPITATAAHNYNIGNNVSAEVSANVYTVDALLKI